MKRNLFVTFLLAASLSAQAQVARTPRRVPVTAAAASTNATAAGEGRAEVNLSFKQSQVDDVLKSLVVLDLGEGRIGAVSYNSSAPPSARMADIPFSIGAASGGGAAGGLAGVLSQLQGARVVVATARGAANGSVLTVEERRERPAPVKPAAVRHALVIAGEGGELMSFDLGTLVTARAEADHMPVHLVRIAGGVVNAHFYRREKKLYTLTNQTDRVRTVYVEHPVRTGLEMDSKETPAPEGKSARFHRFRVKLGPRATE